MPVREARGVKLRGAPHHQQVVTADRRATIAECASEDECKRWVDLEQLLAVGLGLQVWLVSGRSVRARSRFPQPDEANRFERRSKRAMPLSGRCAGVLGVGLDL